MPCDSRYRNTAKSNLASATASKDAAEDAYKTLQAIWVIETGKCDAVQKKYVRCAGASTALLVALALTVACAGWTTKMQL
jgi:hypothetical protein